MKKETLVNAIWGGAIAAVIGVASVYSSSKRDEKLDDIIKKIDENETASPLTLYSEISNIISILDMDKDMKLRKEILDASARYATDYLLCDEFLRTVAHVCRNKSHLSWVRVEKEVKEIIKTYNEKF